MVSLCLGEDGNTRKRSRRINNGDNSSNPKRRRLSYCIDTDNVSTFINGFYSNSDSESESSGFDKLPPDLFQEILIRFPLKFINRCKSVSKAWRSLISAPIFAHSFNNMKKKKMKMKMPLLLVRIERPLPGVSQVYTVPLSATRAASALSFTFDFIPPLCPRPNASCPSGIVPPVLVDTHFKASHAGLILLQGVFRYRRNVHYLHSFLCNPVTKQWLQLPFISTPCDFSLTGFACYTVQSPCSRIWADDDDVDNPEFNPNVIDFTVISVSIDEDARVFIVRLFCSEDDVKTRHWVEFRVPCPHGYTWIEKVNVVFFNGKFHWCGEECIVVYDPFNDPRKCSTIPLPHDCCLDRVFCDFSLHATQGHLRLLVSYSERFFMWEFADYAKKSWVTQSLTTNSNFGDKICLLGHSSTIMLCDTGNASLQHVYTCPFNSLQFFGPFLSRPWPTLLPIHKLNKSSHVTNKIVRVKHCKS